MLTAIYIHIPFCDKVCTYCDFHKEIASFDKKKKYIDSLIMELDNHKYEYNDLKTIYIGGGTPSSLPSELLELLFNKIHELINVKQLVEFTIETNPNDISLEFSKLIKKHGINRVSIGVQTFNENHLKFLGRTHNKIDVVNGINNLIECGINNINVDLMFSLINQTEEELEIDLQEVLKLPIKHISYYSLILEEKTKLHYLYRKKLISMNDEDIEAIMYNRVIDVLTKNKLNHYEISNFSKFGYESIHNKVYWENKDYLGLGSGSHSLYNGKRFSNIRSVNGYIKSLKEDGYPHRETHEIEPLREELIMGLRLLKGVNIIHVNKKFNIDLLNIYPEINDFIDKKLLKIEEDQLFFTRKGLLLGNIVFSIF